MINLIRKATTALAVLAITNASAQSVSLNAGYNYSNF